MVGLDPATPACSSGQRPSSAIGPGSLVEAEWLPGQWRLGNVCDAFADGRVTVRYDDGLLWPVEADKLRFVAGSSSCATDRKTGLAKQADTPVLSRQESFDDAHWSVVTSLTGSTCASERDRRPFTFQGSSRTHHAKASRHEESLAPSTGKVPTEWSARLSYRDWTAGNAGVELRQARDDLLACELESWQRQAELVASAAEVSDDWWHIQAAMQLVTSAGVGGRWTPRLKQAARKLELRSAGGDETHPDEWTACTGTQLLDSILLSSAVAKYVRHRHAFRERRRIAAAKGWPHVLSANGAALSTTDSSTTACGLAWKEESRESEESDCPGTVRKVNVSSRGRRVCCV